MRKESYSVIACLMTLPGIGKTCPVSGLFIIGGFRKAEYIVPVNGVGRGSYYGPTPCVSL